MPVIGVLLGLALASKWVAAYAIGALAAADPGPERARPRAGHPRADRDHRRARLHGDQRAADGRPSGFGNLTFLLIMVALTLLAVVVAVVHPIAWTDEEMRFAVGRARGGSATLVFFGALAAGQARHDHRRSGRWRSRRCSWPSPSALGSLVVVGLFWLGGRSGFGPLAAPPAPDDPIRLLDPPGAAARGLAPAGLAAWASRSSGRRLPDRAAARRLRRARTSRGR